MSSMRRLTVLILLANAAFVFCQTSGEAAYAAFQGWRNAPENRESPWTTATEKYRAKLIDQ